MKIKVLKELEQKRDSAVDKSEKMLVDPVGEAKLLLLNASSMERQVLREAGLDYNLRAMEEEQGMNMERKTFENSMGEKVFTHGEIRNICIKYGLKFLPSRRYAGKIDPILGAKIIHFFEKAKIDGHKFAASNLYIMAPSKAFNLERRPEPPELDPVLFYKVPTRNGEDMYAPIHQWGNDFTILRRMTGIVKRNMNTWLIYQTCLKGLIILAVLSVFTPLDIRWMLPLSLGVGFMWQFVYYLTKYGEDKWEEKTKDMFSEQGWDQEYK